jgi:hypothetical protein
MADTAAYQAEGEPYQAERGSVSGGYCDRWPLDVGQLPLAAATFCHRKGHFAADFQLFYFVVSNNISIFVGK